jgi:hypothetical protein
LPKIAAGLVSKGISPGERGVKPRLLFLYRQKTVSPPMITPQEPSLQDGGWVERKAGGEGVV